MIKFRVVSFLSICLFVFLVSCQKEEPQLNETFFQRSTPEELGLSNSVFVSLATKAQELPNLYSYLVIKDKTIVAESYANGADSESLLHIRSITKSISSILIGIALEEGSISSTDVRLETLYPEYIEQDRDDEISQITLEHILDMQSGFQWNENREAIAWYTSVPDSWSYIFSKPVNTAPGTVFNYNSGAASLLTRFIESNQSLGYEAFAAARLFNRLGINNYAWETDRLGRTRPDAGLQMRAIDLAKIGYLMMHDGFFGDSSIIPSDWIDTSWQFEIDLKGNYITMNKLHYNNLWWMAEYKGVKVYFAVGYGGQLMLCVPRYDLMVITHHEFRLDANVVGEHTSRFITQIFTPLMEEIIASE